MEKKTEFNIIKATDDTHDISYIQFSFGLIFPRPGKANERNKVSTKPCVLCENFIVPENTWK